MKRRSFLKGMLAAGGAAVVCGPVFAAPKKRRIGLLAPSHCALPIVYANETGLFAKHDVSADVVFLDKIEDIVKGISTGDLMFGQITTPLAFAISAGAPNLPKMQLTATQVLGTNGGILAVAANAAVTKTADLKGKRIGVHSPYIMHSLILNLLLEKSGLDPARDLEITIVPMKDMVAALKEGRIDGIISPEPLPSLMVSKGLGKTVLKTKMFWVDHPCCVLTANRAMLRNEKELVRNVTVASMTAGLTLNSSTLRPTAIADIHKKAAAYQQIPLPLLQQAFGEEQSDFYPFPFRSAGMTTVNQMKKQGLLAADVDAEKLVSDVFASEFALEAIREAAKAVKGGQVPAGIDREEKFRLSTT